jgi:hypothetical protein
MTPRTITLEVTSDQQELLLRQMHTMLQELESLSDAAPHGEVLEVCEAAVLSKSRDLARQTLERIVQRRVDAAEKKGRPCGNATAGGGGKIAASAREPS